MLNKLFSTKLLSDYAKKEIERRKIISASNLIINEAKRAIFSAHRGDDKQAQIKISDLIKQVKGLEKTFTVSRLYQEGAYVASVEELAEAHFLSLALARKQLSAIPGIHLSAESYMGGLSDLTGELVRHAVNSIARGQYTNALIDQKIINSVMDKLIQADLTGYQRTKYDQARSNLKKIEEIVYQLKINKLI